MLLELTRAEWLEFTDANREALENDFGGLIEATVRFLNGGFYFGGGAAPLFFIRVKTGAR
jgi:hypothetical protein